MTQGIDQSGLSPAAIADEDALRSQVMKQLITNESTRPDVDQTLTPPRVLVQYWDDKDSIPPDVQLCIDSWERLESNGFKRLLFDDASAITFITTEFGDRHASAFAKCLHPAMRADYFRLCFIAKRGGFYADADDVYVGRSIEELFEDDRLKLNPLCYDIASDAMVDPHLSAKLPDSEEDGQIFYVNNNPLIAPAHHPIVEDALERSTEMLLSGSELDHDIQSLTGPGNLTATVVEHALRAQEAGRDFEFELMRDWDAVARSEWALDYREDHRNWRHWVQGIGDPL